MSDIYAKVGVNERIFFLVRDPATGLADTTFTSGSFTLQIGKDLTGNQSTTGCTFGVLDSTNNPGVAYIDCSGATSFVSVTGNYSLKVYRTSDATQIWTGTVRVTSDGTGAGSWGDASFTAVASNGRITSGGVALSGATVKILNASGVLYVQTTSDVNGVWGPVYFSTAGTYTIQVQKSGYTIASATLTVSGSTATGPGTDIALTATAASSSLLANDLWAYARRMAGDTTGTKSDTEAREAVDDALAYLAMTKQWPYLQDLGRVDLVGAYTTGTVSIANGATAVTLSGGTFPSWAASGVLYINGAWATISTRDSNTQVTLTAAWGEATATAASYTLAQYSYDLPSNLMKIDKIIYAQNWPWEQEVSPAVLEHRRTMWQSGMEFPSVWATRAAKFLVWPWPTTTHRVNILYYKRPALLLSGTDVIEWDPLLLMPLHRAIDYQVAIRGPCVAGNPAECRAALDEAIDACYVWDKTGTDRDLNGGLYPMIGDDLLRGTISS